MNIPNSNSCVTVIAPFRKGASERERYGGRELCAVRPARHWLALRGGCAALSLRFRTVPGERRFITTESLSSLWSTPNDTRLKQIRREDVTGDALQAVREQSFKPAIDLIEFLLLDPHSHDPFRSAHGRRTKHSLRARGPSRPYAMPEYIANERPAALHLYVRETAPARTGSSACTRLQWRVDSNADLLLPFGVLTGPSSKGVRREPVDLFPLYAPLKSVAVERTAVPYGARPTSDHSPGGGRAGDGNARRYKTKTAPNCARNGSLFLGFFPLTPLVSGKRYDCSRKHRCKAIFWLCSKTRHAYSPTRPRDIASHKGRSNSDTHKRKNAVKAEKKRCDFYGSSKSVRVAQNWFKRFQSGNLDDKDKPRSGRPVTDKVDGILDKVEHYRHISSYDIVEELQN
ncbi:hypothetical protein EVAR_11531_1 [Eumeta japonica]|uniref:Mos1 transposase HTH domain-containing protein n=1 Tax=Eumeta variegata TaxID=151549 RepID=A0A4C1TYR9_EUMVA|nr:hypothetical protein EVAR_11531_1 [Eumeta japonica]